MVRLRLRIPLQNVYNKTSGIFSSTTKWMRPYIELTKPRITWLILMSTAIGYFFGLPGAAPATSV